MGRPFKNISRLSLSPSNTIITALAFLGAIVAFLAYQWLIQATSQEVDFTDVNTGVGDTPGEHSPRRMDVDVILMADWSGSMNISDPNNFRLSAAELLASSLALDIYPRHTRMGYIQFSSNAIPVLDLVSIEDEDNRRNLIDAIHIPPPPDRTSSDSTYVMEAFDLADKMLDEARKKDAEKAKDDPSFVPNDPAIVFLTDGVPTDGCQNEVENTIRNLTNKGVDMFLVILHSNISNAPNQSCTTDVNWDEFWRRIETQYPKAKYFDAQSAELEDIYNIILHRLEPGGIRPAQVMKYNPNDSQSYIFIPPGLLQVRLRIERPNEDLIDPNGMSFKDYYQTQDEKNEFVEGHEFNTYLIHRPAPGKWLLKTNANEPLNYRISSESVYYSKMFFSDESACESEEVSASLFTEVCIEPDETAELRFVIVDEQQNPVNDKTFNLTAYKTVMPQDGSLEEQYVLLGNLQPAAAQNTMEYILKIPPDMITGQDGLSIRIDGETNEVEPEQRTPLNVSSYKINVLTEKTEIEFEDVPDSIICDAEDMVFYPPAIRCGNNITITAKVHNAALMKDSLEGKLLSPLNKDNLNMDVIDDSTLQASVHPLNEVGEYRFVVNATGKVEGGDAGVTWHRRAWKNVELEWPLWVEPMKRSLLFASVLLLLIALWKPFFVALLLPLFTFMQIAPSGCYMDTDDDKGLPAEIYDQAMKRRKLFSLTIGTAKNPCDIPIDRGDDPIEDIFTSSKSDRLLLKIYLWIKTRPHARLVAVPWSGIWIEKPSGEALQKASERHYTTINVLGVNVRVGQRDWSDNDAGRES